jgi:hypothetical protein
MDLFSYASGKVSGIIGDSPSPMHYREKYHRGAPDTPDEIGGYRGRSPDTYPFPGASVGDNLKNETAPNPANAPPTRAAFAAWDRDYIAWQEAGCPGGPDAWPRPPAGWSRMGRLIPRTNRSYRTWR